MTNPTTAKSVSISVILDTDLRDHAKALAKSKRMSLAAVVRQALVTALDDEADDLAGAKSAIRSIESALDRVLVTVVRLGDRVETIANTALRGAEEN